MADFPVKWFRSDMGGAPVLSDKTPGEMIALIKACLSTGFNLTPIVSIAYASDTGLATVNVGSGHGFQPWQVIEISGVDQSAYNGEHRVISVGTEWLTFEPDSAPISGAATGESMEIKASPSKSWEMITEDAATYQMAFRSTDPEATEHVVIITDDDPTISGQVDSYADAAKMSVVENYADLSNYDEVMSQWWPVSHRYFSDTYSKYNHTTKDWTLATDGKLIYFMISYAAGSKRSAFVMGNFESVRPGDAHNFMISGFDADQRWSSSGYSCYSDFASSTLSSEEQYRRISRAYNQAPGGVHYSFMHYGSAIGGAFMAPNPMDNGFYVSTARVGILEETRTEAGYLGLRGMMPGLVQPLCTVPYYDQKIHDDIPGFIGRPVIFLLVARDDNGPADTNSFSEWPVSSYDHPYLIALNLDKWT